MASLAKPIDRKRVQARQVEKLQQHMMILEQQMVEQAALRRQLEQISRLDTTRTQKALERASSSNKTLQNEIDRIYGPSHEYPKSPALNAVEEIIAQRTKDFHRSQQEKNAKLQQLAQERLRILEARNRLKEKQDMLRSLPSPNGSDVSEIEMKPPGVHTPSYRSVHSSDSMVRRVVNNLPVTVDKIWHLRDSLQRDYVKTKRPYAGELGITSYEPWQYKDFFMVRDLLEEFINDFLFNHIPSDLKVLKQGRKLQMLEENDKDWKKTSKVLSERAVVKLLAEELLLEVTSKLTEEIAGECLFDDFIYKRISSNMFIKEAEVQATGNPDGRDPNDPAYDIITRTFQSMQKNRDQIKKHIWSHSQLLNQQTSPPPQLLRPVSPPPPMPPKKKKSPPKVNKTPSQVPISEPQLSTVVDEPVDADVTIISFDHLHPVDLIQTDYMKEKDPKERNKKLWNCIYQKREAKYWKNLRPYVFNLTVAKRCQGISVVKPSPDHMQVAIGTLSGDVIIFNTQVEPWMAVKLDVGQTVDGGVVHLAWSLDSSRLLAVKKSGSVFVWLTKGKPALKEHLKVMEFQTNETKPQPFALIPINAFDANKGDLTLTQGSLVEQGTSRGPEKAVLADFFPSLTVLTTQYSICAALQMGDILKLDLETLNKNENVLKAPMLLKPKIQTSIEVPNLTRQNIGAELLRQHKDLVLHVSFVGNIGKMVTVDSAGFILLWKYDKSFLTGFDWFTPEKKFKLNLHRTMFQPFPEDNTKIIFTDQQKNVSRSKIRRERSEAQISLDKLKLGNPWHIIIGKNGLDTYMYAPQANVNDSGAMFNVVVRHRKTQQVSSHMTRMYKPVKLQASAILSVKQTPSGNDLVIVLLFPPYQPKGPYLMILVLHLPTMALRNFRKEIELSSQEHDEYKETKTLSMDVTQTYGPTGSEYLFMTLNGQLNCFSLNSGSSLLCIDSKTRPKAPKFPGLRIDEQYFKVPKLCQVAALGNFGSLYAVLFDQSSQVFKVLRLDDNNPPEDTRLMSKAFKKWEGYKKCPSELRVNPVDCLLPDMKHLEAEMRSLLLSLPFHNEEITREDQEKEKIGNYLALKTKVEKEALVNKL
ncbi:uncharacterized protein LOC131952534 [Physella acuta]|uniref:uncharacterized protein LOC131952534 n=1 Tax=Physella acuta TaxID=109671 RepID=UPI0027DC0F6E|nr:uncharacterized protein LOC131952534 [Physella acuta]